MLNRTFIELLPEGRPAAHLLVSLFGVILLLGCASSTVTHEPPLLNEPVSTDSITALVYHQDAIYLARSNGGGCVIERHGTDLTAPVIVAAVAACPTRIRFSPQDELLLQSSDGVSLLHEEGEPSETFIEQTSTSSHLTREGSVLGWHRGTVAATAEGEWNGPAAILDLEDAVVAVRNEPEGQHLVRLEWPETGTALVETVLAGPIERIEEVEPDDDQKELAVAGRRNGSYDIAIVNAEEPRMNWIPSDPADEIKPRWSPIGYKVSYIVRNRGGDVLRTVHVPTAAMVLIDFPDATVVDYSWLPDGERVIVALSSMLQSDYVVEATYEGSSKRVVIPPLHRYERQVERLSGTPAGSALLMPEGLRYDVRYPLVVWLSGVSEGGVGFNTDLVPLFEQTSVGLVVVNGTAADLDSTFWEELAAMRWVDGERIWIVGDGDTDRIPDSVRRTGRNPDGETARWLVKQIEEGRVEP